MACADLEYSITTHCSMNSRLEKFNNNLTQMLAKMTPPQWQNQWDKFLPDTFLAHCVHTSSSMGVSPFFLMYGQEACLPSERIFETIQCNPMDEEIGSLHEWQLKHVQNLVWFWKEAGQQAAKCMKREVSQHKATYHERGLGIGDLVKWWNEASMKLHLHWDGPFVIHDITDKNVYQLQTWNSNVCTIANDFSVISHPQVLKVCGLQAWVFRRKIWLKCDEGRRKEDNFQQSPNWLPLE